MKIPKPLTLIILDGFGLSDKIEGNAVNLAQTPVIDELFSNYPHAELKPSGKAVGLPEGQMGNSEVGHLNIGAGRIVYQDYSRINMAIEKNELIDNKELQNVIRYVKNRKSSLHLMGLLSDGGVHSHIKHLYALIDVARKEDIENIYIHAILDGRDTPPKSGKKYLKQLAAEIAEDDNIDIASISGRYYTMDRDNRWERTEKAYKAMVSAEGLQSDNVLDAIESSYEEGINDEFFIPTVINSEGIVKNNDGILFFNFRADRARQITRALAIDEFKKFKRKEISTDKIYFVCMTEYDQGFNLPVAFKPMDIKNSLGEVLSKNNIRQLRISETEKYAHVTFFFNGGIEEPYPGEERKLIPSPKVATYDMQPEMSAYKVTETLLGLVNDEKYDVIILNYANPDMVGHTGILDAAISAIEAVDNSLGRLIPAILDKGGQILLTADHGNSEKMIDDDGEPFTAHTTNLVPIIYIGGAEGFILRSGKLADIAPTMLDLLNIKIPEEMTGSTLLIKGEE